MTAFWYIETIKPWFVILFLLMGTWFVYHTIRRRDMYPPEVVIMRVMGVMYGIGKIIQIYVIGPSFVRGYLSDIGWMGIGSLLIPYGLVPWVKTIRWTRWSAHVLFCTAWVSEMLMLLTQTAEIIPGMKFQARGDVIDLTIFAIGYFLILFLAMRLEQRFYPPPTVEKSQPRPRKKKRLFRP